jgi:hypothetical protein
MLLKKIGEHYTQTPTALSSPKKEGSPAVHDTVKEIVDAVCAGAGQMPCTSTSSTLKVPSTRKKNAAAEPSKKRPTKSPYIPFSYPDTGIVLLSDDDEQTRLD